MKVIAINGSPRKNGNTATMLQEILAGAAEKGAETRFIHLNDLNMKGCQGCLVCRENLGTCAYQDDFQDILEEMKKADAIALGTPIYAFNVTGQFKCLLDRCFCFTEADEETGYRSVLPQGKKIALVTSQGNEDAEAYRNIIDYLQLLFSFLSSSSPQLIVQAGTEDKDSARKDVSILNRAREIGGSFFPNEGM
ncbi:MAG: flavodoxin family protein [Candidatus Abyssobacteria bacterium SURF_5]|uniref:Flavodoxin family protein n=1 Tax=Abyssobacteria bacterium (strain SURF_5) TaxID=2093360 RepID=A0A3A4NJ22_ABYX5|nr:MAG: flavodoxin family protein [Candidatus Abyssubacteria bacterium SURF_5]